MWILCLLIGFIVGSFAGLVLAAWASVESDKKAIDYGMIKLCGAIYRIEKIDV
jgi:hypothetical protein